jgi:CCR4-NOT transcription complex subunit 3
MERFKACEKEMKTKAFSKEGLLASSKMDPKEKERHEMGHFLMEMVEELGKQVEQAESEQESLQIALKKGRKDAGKVERLSEVEHLVERHKWHQGRLELILRLLENGNIQTEQVYIQTLSCWLIRRLPISRKTLIITSMKIRRSTSQKTRISTMI